jgi:hypothetical protein
VIFYWAARVIDVCLCLARALRGAWRACPGDLMALLVMRACDIREPSRRVRAGGVSAVLVEHSRAAHYLDHQWIPVHAQTLGRYVFARAELSPEIVDHELEHVRQWQRLGPLFLPAYVASSGWALLRRRDPYRANRFEVAARRCESRASPRDAVHPFPTKAVGYR